MMIELSPRATVPDPIELWLMIRSLPAIDRPPLKVLFPCSRTVPEVMLTPPRPLMSPLRLSTPDVPPPPAVRVWPVTRPVFIVPPRDDL